MWFLCRKIVGQFSDKFNNKSDFMLLSEASTQAFCGLQARAAAKRI